MGEVIHVTDLDDPRLDAYRNLKDRELARQGGRFIAEGEHLAVRLLASELVTESVLVAKRRLDRMQPRVPAGVPLYVVDDPLIQEVVGFHFHSGILACGVRPGAVSLDQFAERIGAGEADRAIVVLVLPHVINHDNVGSLMRIAHGFGVAGVLLGQRCCDPFWRRSVRVSMGSIFRLPIRRTEDVGADLSALRERWGFRCVASVCEGGAVELARASRPRRLALMIGPEDQGLSADLLACADEQVTIPMPPHADSLNIAIAGAVMLYHYTQVARMD